MFDEYNVGRGDLLRRLLLSEDGTVEVGGIYRLDFERALVLTADIWKRDAGGIPQFCFLLATSELPTPQGPTLDDEVLLLRVERNADLAQERDLLAVREEALRDALVSGRDPSVSEVMYGLDPYTRERISFTGLDCQVLGTFFEDRSVGDAVLDWGSDIDNFYASNTYRVYKPYGRVLERIASFIRPPNPTVRTVRLGSVRYASTRRKASQSGHASAAVSVNIQDFIGQKTGMFGMTRMGKSNTMKTIATQVFIAAAQQERSIGQLIFDPQGEYANVNTQDQTALAAIGEENVRIYRFGDRSGGSHIRPLGINFFDANQIGLVQDMIAEELASIPGAAGYVRDFSEARFDAPEDDRSAASRASRARLILYGSLLRAGFDAPAGLSVRVSMKRSLAESIERAAGVTLPEAGTGHRSVSREAIEAVLDWLIRNEASDDDASDFMDDISFQSVISIYTGSSGGRTVRGYRNLIPLRVFHNPTTATPVSDEIYSDLLEGRIVIVDLHLGPQTVIKRLSENIVTSLIARQTDAFAGGNDPPQIQVVVEEAHNLFERSNYSESLDPWVRLAKEASKLNIGLVYATQEVTGVAPQVLANTKNWVVAHLNNTREVQELSRYYDFRAFADAIIRSEDRGYVRLKTESSPFVIPVQVDMFGPDMINEARAASGLATVAFANGGHEASA